MDPVPSTRPRRWQFGLSTLLMAVTLIAVGMAWYTRERMWVASSEATTLELQNFRKALRDNKESLVRRFEPWFYQDGIPVQHWSKRGSETPMVLLSTDELKRAHFKSEGFDWGVAFRYLRSTEAGDIYEIAVTRGKDGKRLPTHYHHFPYQGKYITTYKQDGLELGLGPEGWKETTSQR